MHISIYEYMLIIYVCLHNIYYTVYVILYIYCSWISNNAYESQNFLQQKSIYLLNITCIFHELLEVLHISKGP